MASRKRSVRAYQEMQLEVLHDILAGMPLDDVPCLLLADEVCFILRICDNTRNQLEKDEVLIPRRMGRNLRYHPRDVQRYINSL